MFCSVIAKLPVTVPVFGTCLYLLLFQQTGHLEFSPVQLPNHRCVSICEMPFGGCTVVMPHPPSDQADLSVIAYYIYSILHIPKLVLSLMVWYCMLWQC